jgi:hypothetical protein
VDHSAAGDGMFLNEKTSGHMVEVLSLRELFDPYDTVVVGRYHYGEEVQDAENFAKADLVFLSGEDLPRCWVDPHYRDAEVLKK